MPRKALIIKSGLTPKFSTRKVNRCFICGRARGKFRPYKKMEAWLCRMDFKKLFRQGRLPGFEKASW